MCCQHVKGSGYDRHKEGIVALARRLLRKVLATLQRLGYGFQVVVVVAFVSGDESSKLS